MVVVCVILALTTWFYVSGREARAAEPDAKARFTAGTQCVVYFRGDACGQALNHVASVRNCPSVSGTIVSADEQWLVLETNKTRTHIPQNVILVVDVVQK